MDSKLLNVVLVAYVILFLWFIGILWKNRRTINCADLVTNRHGKLSRVALAQLSGVIVASWLPIHMAITDKIDSMVLLACLSYLGAVEGYSKWLAHKEGQSKKEAQ